MVLSYFLNFIKRLEDGLSLVNLWWMLFFYVFLPLLFIDSALEKSGTEKSRVSIHPEGIGRPLFIQKSALLRVCVYIYICIYICVYIYICIYVCIYIYVCIMIYYVLFLRLTLAMFSWYSFPESCGRYQGSCRFSGQPANLWCYCPHTVMLLKSAICSVHKYGPLPIISQS